MSPLPIQRPRLAEATWAATPTSRTTAGTWCVENVCGACAGGTCACVRVRVPGRRALVWERLRTWVGVVSTSSRALERHCMSGARLGLAHLGGCGESCPRCSSAQGAGWTRAHSLDHHPQSPHAQCQCRVSARDAGIVRAESVRGCLPARACTGVCLCACATVLAYAPVHVSCGHRNGHVCARVTHGGEGVSARVPRCPSTRGDGPCRARESTRG